MNILLASAEVAPFAKTGGLGDMAEILPQSLNGLGEKCAVVTPLYRLVRKNGYSPDMVKKDIPLKIGGKDYTFDLSVINHKGTEYYFVGNDSLYDRENLYGTPQGDYSDNIIRYGLFSRAVLEIARYLGKQDIIHCNDWHTGLVPFYLKTMYKDDEFFKGTKVLYTIHNIAYQGLFPKEMLPVVDIPKEHFTPKGVEFYDKISFMKTGIAYSDAISTVSEGYSREMLTKEFGCGLDGLLKSRGDDIYGILNGADYATWNPTTDEFIIKNYDEDTLGNKIECKKDLLKEFGIPFNEEAPLIGMITRLAEQKGVDLVVQDLEDILALGANFIILGTGDERYNKLFENLDKKYKGRAGAKVTFNNPLAHKIEAGSDIFLMPSRYEPCGLNQMYSLKYATIPVVRGTGGLEDTIEDFDPHTKKGNGFKFKRASGPDMLEAIKRAVDVFKDKATWKSLMKSAMKYDFSWKASAKRYIKLYKDI